MCKKFQCKCKGEERIEGGREGSGLQDFYIDATNALIYERFSHSVASDTGCECSLGIFLLAELERLADALPSVRAVSIARPGNQQAAATHLSLTFNMRSNCARVSRRLFGQRRIGCGPWRGSGHWALLYRSRSQRRAVRLSSMHSRTRRGRRRTVGFSLTFAARSF